ncbi:MAG TPA: hypothetical protein VGX76_20040 [Pirellulales bacterium]|nr:hypothetical protein [Pirellulales bacterium]
MLADKVSGDLAGLWLLVAEHLRLGTWDLLRTWTGQPGDCVEPRLALPAAAFPARFAHDSLSAGERTPETWAPAVTKSFDTET